MRVNPSNRTKSVNEYYFSSKLRDIRTLERNGINVINLGIGNPDLNPPPAVTDKLSLLAGELSMHGYQSYRGVPELRDAFSRWYKVNFKVDLIPESEILPLMGSKEGIMHISMAFLNRGDGVLIPDPGYPAYEAATKLCDGRPVYYNLNESNGWFPDLDVLELNGLEGIKLMWVNYPHMPSGKNAKTEQFSRLVEFGIRNSILIVNDNPYSLILNSYPVSIFSAEGSKEIALELNSLSKSHNMAGWRIGVVSGAAEYIESILKIKSNMDSGMFLPLQLAAAEALAVDGSWNRELNLIYCERRKIVFKLAKLLGCSFDKAQSGMFVWARIPDLEISSTHFSDMILEKYGVFITPGSVFGSNGHRYIRISLCVPEVKIAECYDRVKNQ